MPLAPSGPSARGVGGGGRGGLVEIGVIGGVGGGGGVVLWVFIGGVHSLGSWVVRGNLAKGCEGGGALF